MGFDQERVTPAAAQRLRRFAPPTGEATGASGGDAAGAGDGQRAAGAPGGGEGAGPLAGVCAALRCWVYALLGCEAAQSDVGLFVEASSATPAMAAACECVCDLYGLHDVEDDLRGVLLMADQFPFRGGEGGHRVRRGGAGGGAGRGRGGTAAADAASPNEEGEDGQGEEGEEGAGDGEVARLQEQAATLSKLLSMMESDVKEAAAALPRLLREIGGEDFNYKVRRPSPPPPHRQARGRHRTCHYSAGAPTPPSPVDFPHTDLAFHRISISTVRLLPIISPPLSTSPPPPTACSTATHIDSHPSAGRRKGSPACTTNTPAPLPSP